MDSAALALHTAAVATLRGDTSSTLSALGIDSARDVSVQPSQGQALPYILAGGFTEIETGKSSTASVTEHTLSYTAWGRTWEEAVALAEAAVGYLADRAGPLAPAGFTLIGARVDLVGPPIEDRTAEGTLKPWGCPFRIRYQISRTE